MTETEPQSRRDPGPVIRGLRIGGDEVQFARVLAEVCGGDPRAAKQFVRTVLNAAGVKFPLRGSVECRNESGIVGYGRGTIHRQAKKLGSIDLLFTDQGRLRLYCELKINASYQPGQIPKYLEGGKASHVVGIVRRAMQEERTVRDPRWIGEVTWGQIVEDLRALPMPSAKAREQWLDLLALMEMQEDFATGAPNDAAPADMEFAVAVASRVLRHLRSELRARSDQRAGWLAEDLIAGEPFPTYQGRWACVELLEREDPSNVYFRITVRHVESGAGVVNVTWVPWESPSSVVKKQAPAHRKLEALADFERVGGKTRPRYRFERPVGGGSYKKKLRTAAAHAMDAVNAVLDEKLLDYDIELYVAE